MAGGGRTGKHLLPRTPLRLPSLSKCSEAHGGVGARDAFLNSAGQATSVAADVCCAPASKKRESTSGGGSDVIAASGVLSADGLSDG
jgi:hypothetical protein